MQSHICTTKEGKYEMSGRISKQILKQPCINLFIARLNRQSTETNVKRVINSFTSTTSFARGCYSYTCAFVVFNIICLCGTCML
jgi:hypothetical protein